MGSDPNIRLTADMSEVEARHAAIKSALAKLDPIAIERKQRRAAAFSRAVHFAAGFMGTGAVILSQQHVMTPHVLRILTFRCCLLAVLWGVVWEFFLQGVIADLKPDWKWARKPDLAAAAAFPLGAAVAVATFVVWVTA